MRFALRGGRPTLHGAFHRAPHGTATLLHGAATGLRCLFDGAAGRAQLFLDLRAGRRCANEQSEQDERAHCVYIIAALPIAALVLALLQQATPPVMLSKPSIPYPAGAQGDATVELELSVDATGRVTDAR